MIRFFLCKFIGYDRIYIMIDFIYLPLSQVDHFGFGVFCPVEAESIVGE